MGWRSRWLPTLPQPQIWLRKVVGERALGDVAEPVARRLAWFTRRRNKYNM